MRSAVVLALLLAAGPARADEGESSLSAGLAVATLSVPKHAPVGGALAIDYAHGLTPSVWLRAAASGALYVGDGGETVGGQATLGLSYALDILKYVPSVDLAVGANLIDGGGIALALHPVVEIGLALDVLHGRDRSFGGFVRLASFVDEASFVTAGLRATYRWGFF